MSCLAPQEFPVSDNMVKGVLNSVGVTCQEAPQEPQSLEH